MLNFVRHGKTNDKNSQIINDSFPTLPFLSLPFFATQFKIKYTHFPPRKGKTVNCQENRTKAQGK